MDLRLSAPIALDAVSMKVFASCAVAARHRTINKVTGIFHFFSMFPPLTHAILEVVIFEHIRGNSKLSGRNAFPRSGHCDFSPYAVDSMVPMAGNGYCILV